VTGRSPLKTARIRLAGARTGAQLAHTLWLLRAELALGALRAEHGKLVIDVAVQSSAAFSSSSRFRPYSVQRPAPQMIQMDQLGWRWVG
jgi:hypothetical protein